MRKFFLQPVTLSRWCVVSFLDTRRLSEQEVHEYVASLQEAMGKTGWYGGGSSSSSSSSSSSRRFYHLPLGY